MGTLEHEVAAARAAGRRLGPFVLLGELGRGGMGVVLRAWDERRGATVALKVLESGVTDREVTKRLAREAAAVAALDHPGIVRLLEAGEVEGRAFVALELVVGAPLADRLPPRGDLDLRGAVRALRDVAAALVHAHQRGVVHRDLKPSNVLVDLAGNGRLIDFGLARLALDRRRLTATGALLGTPEYMAPEQANGQAVRAGPAADVWGLGALLYLVLSGRPPFVAASVLGTLRAIMEDAPARPARSVGSAEPELEALTLACLTKEEAARPSAAEVERILSRWLEPGPERPRRAARTRRARRRTIQAALVLAVAIGAALALLAARTGPGPSSAPPAPLVSGAPVAPIAPIATARPIERAPAELTRPLEGRIHEAILAGELALASQLLEETLARWPDDPALLGARANVRWRRSDHAGARHDAERAVALDPDDPGTHTVLGVVCSAQGDHVRAAPELDQAVALATAAGDPSAMRSAYLGRARARRRISATAGALEDTAALLRLDPADGLALAERALVLLESGQGAEAWAVCSPLVGGPLELEPRVAPAIVRCALVTGDTALATRVLEAVRGPRSPALLAAEADLAFCRGDLAGAQAALVASLALDPGDGMAWGFLASVRARSGDGAGCLQAAEEGARLGSMPAGAWFDLGVDLLVVGRAVEALGLLERCLALDPGRMDARLGCAQLLLRVGDLREAEARAAALVRDDPTRVRSWVALALARTRLGDLDGADEALRSTIDLVRQSGEVEAPLRAAIAERSLARPETLPEAEAAIQHLLSENPELPEGRWLNALLRLQRGDAAGAEEEASAALALPARPPGGLLADPFTARARARAALGKLDEALADADEAIAQRPRAREAFAARAEVHRLRGDAAKAEADLARARSLDGGR